MSFANSLQSSILHLDTHCGSRTQGIQIGQCRSAMSVSYAEANFIVFSMPCFQQTTQLKNLGCQNIMNPLSLVCWIISTRALLIPIITVLPGLRWKLIKAIIPLGECDSYFKLLLAEIDIVSVQMTFGRSRFSMEGQEELQYCPCQ